MTSTRLNRASQRTGGGAKGGGGTAGGIGGGVVAHPMLTSSMAMSPR